MTREEAIKTLKDRIEQYTGGVHPGEREILLEAFAVLRPAPAPETGLVDREPGFDSRRDGGESMMVEKWRKKPVVVEAIKWTGDNFKDIKAWSADVGLIEGVLCVSTLEGQMVAAVGDYIIKGVNGEFYPCKPDIFDKTYEAAGEVRASE